MTEDVMLKTLVVILSILWLLGAFVAPDVAGNAIHLLLVMAIAIVVFLLPQKRKRAERL